MSPTLAALGYLLAAVCFILTLKGLSSPASAQRSSIIGLVGMAVAVLSTLPILPDAGPGNYLTILLALATGAGLGMVLIGRFETIAMPYLMATCQGLVSMAAVLIAAAALNNAYAGWATACTCFMLNNLILIIAGGLVGSSSTALAYLVSEAMNRSLFSVILEGSPAIPPSTSQLTMR